MLDTKITNALGIVSSLLLWVVMMIGYDYVMSIKEVPKVIAIIGYGIIVVTPGIVGVVVSTLTLTAI